MLCIAIRLLLIFAAQLSAACIRCFEPFSVTLMRCSSIATSFEVSSIAFSRTFSIIPSGSALIFSTMSASSFWEDAIDCQLIWDAAYWRFLDAILNIFVHHSLGQISASVAMLFIGCGWALGIVFFHPPGLSMPRSFAETFLAILLRTFFGLCVINFGGGSVST